jgi:hypothetical protein
MTTPTTTTTTKTTARDTVTVGLADGPMTLTHDDDDAPTTARVFAQAMSTAWHSLADGVTVTLLTTTAPDAVWTTSYAGLSVDGAQVIAMALRESTMRASSDDTLRAVSSVLETWASGPRVILHTVADWTEKCYGAVYNPTPGDKSRANVDGLAAAEELERRAMKRLAPVFKGAVTRLDKQGQARRVNCNYASVRRYDNAARRVRDIMRQRNGDASWPSHGELLAFCNRDWS